MIDLDYHPEVTREMAQDPAFCIPWAAERFANGRATDWTQFKLLKARYGDGLWPE